MHLDHRANPQQMQLTRRRSVSTGILAAANSRVNKRVLFDLRRLFPSQHAYHLVRWREPRIADGMDHREL
jgi:hypothetical protein